MINSFLPIFIILSLLFQGPISYSFYLFSFIILGYKIIKKGLSLKLNLKSPIGAFSLFSFISIFSLITQLLYGDIDFFSYAPQFYGLTKIPFYLFAIEQLTNKNKKKLINILAIYIIFASFISLLFILRIEGIEKIHSLFGKQLIFLLRALISLLFHI